MHDKTLLVAGTVIAVLVAGLCRRSAASEGDNAPSPTTAAAFGKAEPNAQTTRSKAPPKRENYLGIFTQPIPPAVAAQILELSRPGGGLMVTRVLPASPAERAGLKRFDVLRAYDDQPLRSTGQLKKLVLDDTRGRTVTLKVIRAAKLRSVNVPLGERDSKRSSMTLRLEPGPSGTRAIPLRSIIVSGDRLRRENADRTTPSPHRSVNVWILSKPNHGYEVQARTTDTAGKPLSWKSEGSLDSVLGTLKEMPKLVSDRVESGLRQLQQTQKQGGTALRFHLRPGVDGGDRTVQVLIVHPGQDGTVRLFQLDHRFDRGQVVNGGDLLKIDSLAGELEKLGPAVREKLESTVRRVRIPEIRIRVQESQ